MDGTSVYMVMFPRAVLDIRDATEKLQIQFSGYGRHHVRKLGDDKAAALAYVAFAASRLSGPENVKCGCGPLNDHGFHGNECGEFWIYGITDYTRRVYQADCNAAIELCAPGEML